MIDWLLGEYLDSGARFFPLLAMPLFAFATTRAGGRAFFRANRTIRRASRPAWGGPVLAMTIAMAVSAPAVWWREPEPQVHDEFSYLLAADTFASGRLTNPTHPVWPSFETMHVIHTPSYQSKYPPGQGLVLAAGQVLLGRPVAGAWVCGGLAVAALTWFFGLVLPRRWATVGGLIAAVHPLLFEWSQSYWGGGLTMLGGTLVLGGAIVAQRRGSIASGVAIGVGLAILGLTRPSEGGLLALIAAAWLGWRTMRDRRAIVPLLLRVALPASLIAGAAAGWLAYYHAAVTDSYARLPYVEHIARYGVAPPYVWQERRPVPTYYSRPLEELQSNWELAFWERHQTAGGYAVAVVRKLYVVARDYAILGALILPLVAGLAVCRRDRVARAALVGYGGFLGVVVLNQTWTMAHYVAPAAGLLLLLVTIGLRRLRAAGGGTGRVLARATVLLFVVAATRTYADELRAYGWHYDRAELARRLVERGGEHLVVVRYGPGHDLMMEWVANGADIDGQRVVWAHELEDDAHNRKLIKHFEDTGRQAWLLRPDEDFFELVPYELPAQANRAAE